MAKHFMHEFTCDRCGETYINDMSDEEVEAEVRVQEEAGIDCSPENTEVLCDTCFNKDPDAAMIVEATREFLQQNKSVH